MTAPSSGKKYRPSELIFFIEQLSPRLRVTKINLGFPLKNKMAKYVYLPHLGKILQILRRPRVRKLVTDLTGSADQEPAGVNGWKQALRAEAL